MIGTLVPLLVQNYTHVPLLLQNYTHVPLLVQNYTHVPLLVQNYTHVPLEQSDNTYRWRKVIPRTAGAKCLAVNFYLVQQIAAISARLAWSVEKCAICGVVKIFAAAAHDNLYLRQSKSQFFWSSSENLLAYRANFPQRKGTKIFRRILCKICIFAISECPTFAKG